MRKVYLIIFALLAIIFILIIILILRKPQPVIQPVDDTKQLEEIRRLEAVNDSLNAVILEQQDIRDSVIVYKEKIKTIYREKYIYIGNSNAVELDSIIRTSIN